MFAATLFLSAFLLFALQPMFAKMVLPMLGGAPAVWNGCMVFYQAVLLAGYVYAHVSLKWFGLRGQALLHLVLLAAALFAAAPIRVAGESPLSAAAPPTLRLWLLLSISIGLPFFALSASAPMLQAWFARTHRPAARDPYFLYAASNLGSLAALLAYPLLIETCLPLSRQGSLWAVGLGALLLLFLACAASMSIAVRQSGIGRDGATAAAPRGTAGRAESGAAAGRPSLARRLRWLALALVPASLLLGVTTYISSEITPRPLLWVVPLALYLATFVLVFARRAVLPQAWMVRAQPVLIVAAAASLLCTGAGLREILLLGGLHLAAFFVTAMVCHGQLAADRPEPQQLTEFYLWLSLGGVLGGLFSALVAPLIFHRVLEYPMMMAAACMLRPRPAVSQRSRNAVPVAALLLCLVIAWGLRSQGFLSGWRFTDSPAMRIAMVGLAVAAVLLLRARPLVFGTALAALATISIWSAETGADELYGERTFFGILRVERDPIWNTHQLLHGTTVHGQQCFDERHRREPRGYYHRTGPLGKIFDSFRPRRPFSQVGVLGLGAGAIAAYAEPGERFTFYEIDPAVERIARNKEFFTYLADCRGEVEVVIGDARLSLIAEQDRRFDLLIADVFNSDAVPAHLMTREAIELYFDRLKPGGLLAMHVSSRYYDLEPVLGRLAADLPRAARIWRDRSESGIAGRNASVWVVMARSDEDLGPLLRDRVWEPLRCGAGPAWTDDYSNIAGALTSKTSGLRLIPWRWLKSDKAGEHALRARSLLEEDRVDEAIGHFEQSLAIDPDNASIQYGLGAVLAARGRTDEAIERYQEALAIDPDHVRAHGDLGVALAKRGRTEESLGHLRWAVALDPDYVEALSNLGKVLLDTGAADEAMACLRRAAGLKPQDAQLLRRLGQALEQQGKTADALDAYRRASSLAETQNDARLAETLRTDIRRCETNSSPR